MPPDAVTVAPPVPGEGARLELAPPPELGPSARGEWERVVAELAAKDMLTELDRAALAAYCGAYALWADAIANVQKFGSVVKTAASGFPVQSPYVAIANKQAAVMMSIAAEFGFTPSTRGKLPAPGRFAKVDLFGDPVPENWGARGRPEHIRNQATANKITMLLALGWSIARISKTVGVTPPTLRKHYKGELRHRDESRDRLQARTAMLLWEQFERGSTVAGRVFRELLAENDRMRIEADLATRPEPVPVPTERSLGKKAFNEHLAAEAEAELRRKLEREAAANAFH